MKTMIHRSAGFLGMLLMITFFSSTLVVELGGDKTAVATVKQMIVYGLFILVPALIITASSGQAITGARQGRLIKTKMKRTIFTAANGLLILVPSAIILNNLAAAGAFGPTFYLLQTIELVAGAINIGLMGLNIRAGLLLSGRFRRKARPAISTG